MQVQNVTGGSIQVSDIPGAQAGSGLALQPGVVTTIFDEDAEKSQQLASFIAAGSVAVVGAAEPATGTSVGGTPAADVTADLQANAAAASAAQSSANTALANAATADGKAVTAQGAASAAASEIAAVAVGGVLKSPRSMSGDPTVGISVFPFTPAVGVPGRLKKTYVAEIPGFEYEFESFEGMNPRLQGSLATGRLLGGLPYTTTRYTKAQRAAIPALVTAGLVNITRATVGINPQVSGANYLPDFDVNGGIVKSALQKAHDDMEANGTAVLIEIRGGYNSEITAAFPNLDVTKNFRLVGAFGAGNTANFSQAAQVITVFGFGQPGVPAIRVTKLTPGVITLTLANLRVQAFDAPAIELVGNVNLRASNCFFDSVNGGSGLPFPTIKMSTTGGAISILTDCSIHNSTVGGDCVTYEGVGGTNWMRIDRGSHRVDSGGSFINVINGFSNLELKETHIDVFNPKFAVKNTMGTPITISALQSSAGQGVDANVTVSYTGEL